MNLRYINHPFDYILIDSFFNQNEYDEVWKELMFLEPKMRDPDERFSKNFKGEPNRKGRALFLRDLFANREMSSIFQHTRKLHSDELRTFFATQTNYLINGMKLVSNSELIVVQNYIDGDYYKPHKDFSLLTVITLLCKTPQQFTGGELHFSKFDHTVELKNNQTIIFPSFVKHAVNTVKMQSKNAEDGRFTITNFLQQGEHLE